MASMKAAEQSDTPKAASAPGTAQRAASDPPRMLLHACCGPCSLEPVRLLAEEGYDLTIYYANSNIAPREEYARRLSTITAWARSENLPILEGPYDPQTWEASAGHIADPEKREARCRACYRLRFEEAARYAVDHGYQTLGTTLSVSPFQYTDIIREELERAAKRAGIAAAFRDFRPNYQEATRRSRELGMYRQNYCGCRFSIEEAKHMRAERRQEREHEKALKAAAQAEKLAAADAARRARRAERAAYDEKRRRQREALRAFRAQHRGADSPKGENKRA